MLDAYRAFLLLYPQGHRAKFGEEMYAVFADAEQDVAGASLLAQALFYTREFTGLVRGAIAERLYCMTGFRSWNVLPFRRYTMRSEFRFSKATPILMALILFGIVVAIEKAMAIRSADLGMIRVEHFPFWPLVIALGGAYLAGMIGWAILFALRRSGVHRLDSMNGPQS